MGSKESMKSFDWASKVKSDLYLEREPHEWSEAGAVPV